MIPKVIENLMTPVFEKIWRQDRMPVVSWMKEVIIKLLKQGDVQHCENWVSICALFKSKFLSCILLIRLTPTFNELIRLGQHGFRANISCTVLVDTITVIAEQLRKSRKIS